MTSLGSFCTKARTKIISNSGARYIRLSLCILKFDVSNASIPAAAVERRPMKHVRMHLQRRFSPLNQLGKWTSNEDETLIQWVFIKYVTCRRNIIGSRAVADLGQKWTEVSRRVGRTNADCRDRYRNHLADRAVRNSGMVLLLVDVVYSSDSMWRHLVSWRRKAAEGHSLPDGEPGKRLLVLDRGQQTNG